MNRYPLTSFPKTTLRPDVVARHEAHLKALSGDIEGYSKIGSRDQNMYVWLLRVIENLGLSTVNKHYFDSLAITKTRISMFVVLVDDPVDNVDKRNPALTEEMLKIPFGLEYINIWKLNTDERAYLEFAKSLWAKVMKEVKRYPRYRQYQSAFRFDVEQLLNSVRYSRFVNTSLHAANLTENKAYGHHSMIVLIQTDLDLMCSDGFDDNEFGNLREFLYVSQEMASLGNLLGTYTREIEERDMSSGVFLRLKDKETLEKDLKNEWRKKYKLAQKLAKNIKSIDGDMFMKQIEFVQEVYQMKADDW